MKRFLALLLISIALISCKKTTWDNTKFRCKIDGEEFVVKDAWVTAKLDGTNFTIDATKASMNPYAKKPFGEMEIDFYLDTTGVYSSLNGTGNTWRWSNHGGKTYSSESYRASADDPGDLFITSIDYDAEHIEGTFNLTAYGDDGTTIEVTEGYFNLDW